LKQLHRDALYHSRMLDLLEIEPNLMPPGNIAGPIRQFYRRARKLYDSGQVREKPPLNPGVIDTDFGTPVVGPAREVSNTLLRWCERNTIGMSTNVTAPTPPNVEQGDATSQAWISLAEAERVTGVHRGTISRAIDAGELKGNREKGKGKRKVDAMDLVRWSLHRSKKPDRIESEQHVKGLVSKHVKPEAQQKR
jgi:hypothetical protein